MKTYTYSLEGNVSAENKLEAIKNIHKLLNDNNLETLNLTDMYEAIDTECCGNSCGCHD